MEGVFGNAAVEFAATSRMRSIGNVGRVRTTGIQPAWTMAFETKGDWLAANCVLTSGNLVDVNHGGNGMFWSWVLEGCLVLGNVIGLKERLFC